MDPTVLEALAGLDGAVVTDLDGRLLTFGAILKIDPEAITPTTTLAKLREQAKAKG